MIRVNQYSICVGCYDRTYGWEKRQQSIYTTSVFMDERPDCDLCGRKKPQYWFPRVDIQVRL